LKIAKRRSLQDETVLIQVPREEMMQKVVVRTQLHEMVVMMTQMMIQSQPPQQRNRHQSPIMRSNYITWTLLKVHSQHFYGGPCRESAFH
jgi:hypothetical protein